jgi:hypothetical protein
MLINKIDHTQIGLAGEYYVLAQLTQRGLIATLTLSTTKGVDILVTNQELERLYKVEVKTTHRPPHHERLFGDKKFYSWPMGEKHETITDKNLFYCFVFLQDPGILPKFFIMPAKKVARYVKWQHQYWLKTRESKVNETAMRMFRIAIEDPDGYENNWDVFKRKSR